MRHQTGLVIVAMLTVICQVSPASGGMINGGFESGDLSGWATSNAESYLAYATGTLLGVAPTEGNWQAYVRGGNNTNGANGDELEAFLGIPNGALGVGMEGGAIKQTFTASAGSILSFDWNLIGNRFETLDFAFATVDGTLYTLADMSSATLLVEPPDDVNRQTGYKTFTLTLLTSGTHTLGLGAMNVGSVFNDPNLLVDNVHLQSATVPEPSSLLMGTIGILALSAIPRLKRIHRAGIREFEVG